MFCIKCGKENVEDAVFCTYCGAKIETLLTSNQPQPSKKKFSIISAVAAVVVIIAILLFVAVKFDSKDINISDEGLTTIEETVSDIDNSGGKTPTVEDTTKTKETTKAKELVSNTEEIDDKTTKAEKATNAEEIVSNKNNTSEETTKIKETTTKKVEISKNCILDGVWENTYKTNLQMNGFDVGFNRKMNLEFKDGKCYMRAQENLDMIREEFISKSHAYYVENYTEEEIIAQLEKVGHSSLDEMFDAQYECYNRSFYEMSYFRYDLDEKTIYFWSEGETESEGYFEELVLKGNTITMESIEYTLVS